MGWPLRATGGGKGLCLLQYKPLGLVIRGRGTYCTDMMLIVMFQTALHKPLEGSVQLCLQGIISSIVIILFF